MTAKHTPGPWARVPQTQGGDLIAREYFTGKQMNQRGLRLVCFMLARADSFEEDEANARLIAAAPETAAQRDRLRVINAELLAALEAALRIRPNRHDLWVPAARAALAKARGET